MRLPEVACLALVILLQLVIERVLTSSNNGTVVDDTNLWKKFKTLQHRRYSLLEDKKRFNIWSERRQLIRQHNANAATKDNFTLGENQFLDWLPEEYNKMLGFRSSSPYARRPKTSSYPVIPPRPPLPPQLSPYKLTVNVSSLPTTVDWTKLGYVNPVQDQGQCGVCWAFSACGALEGQYYKVTGTSAVMSEQNLLDCSGSYGNLGCNGGSMNAAFAYVQQTKGIDAFATYPYTAQAGSCRYSSSASVGYNTGYQSVQTFDELALQQAVAMIGPISVGIDASLPTFQLYRSGVYKDTKCSSTVLDHAVLVVGYGNENGQDYWLLKNSWGTSWGMQGYMKLARNANNLCGVATDASFPLTFIPSGYNPGTGANVLAAGATKIYDVPSLVFVILLTALLCNLIAQ